MHSEIQGHEYPLIHSNNNGDPVVYGWENVGVPIRSDDFIKSWLNKHLDDYRSEANAICSKAVGSETVDAII